LTGNTNYPNPPVDLTVFKTALDTYSLDITASADGSKKAIAVKKKQAKLVVHMLRQYATYVEANTNGDMAVFTTSGFQAAPTTRPPAAPIAQPVISKIDQGTSGQLLVSIPAISGAHAYNLRYATLTGGVPGPWTVLLFSKVKPPVSVTSLTPGTTYAFQVQALGSLGTTAWSDSITKMST